MRFAKTKLTQGIYFEDVFIRPKDLIDRIVTEIKTSYPKAGGIVSASGISGAALVVPVAMHLDWPFGFVRTKGSHSQMGRVDGHEAMRSPVILDDFISSGTTMRKTIRHLLQDERALMPAGIVLYGCYSKKKVECINSQWSTRLTVNGKSDKYSFPISTFRSAD